MAAIRPEPQQDISSNTGESQIQGVIRSIQQQCLDKGLGGLKGLSVLFRSLDRDYSKTLTFNEVKQGFSAYKIQVTDADIGLVFHHFDHDNSGAIDFKEFLLAFTPSMSPCRVDVVHEAFDKLDHNKDGLLKSEDLMVTYRTHAENHPNFRSGRWSIEQVLQTFLKTFDSQHAPDGKVTRDEFLQYYAGVSCTIEDDAYFDLVMRASWGLPQRNSRK